ncbi:hypothetical protein F1880_000175 [Penicillium rolfsii]|nr:hypothetical protein F1880_000175 [Penicillium rolfsii]
MSSALERLPNELLDQIIAYLDEEPPSQGGIYQEPDDNITTSENKCLKYLSQSCARLATLVRPMLFVHARMVLPGELSQFCCFTHRWELARNIKSMTVLVTDEHIQRDALRGWIDHLFGFIDPLRLTILAPPKFIGDALQDIIDERHGWAFGIKYQILQLEQNTYGNVAAHQPDPSENILRTRPWTSFFFNEGSSLKAYNHYEYFLSRVPSVLGQWGEDFTLMSYSLEHHGFFQGLQCLTYIAIFPFYNHVELICIAMQLLPRLRVVTVQLAPDENNHATELEQRGSMDPNDPWMELESSYSVIGFKIRTHDSVEEFRTRDLHIEAVRPQLTRSLKDELHGWMHDAIAGFRRQHHVCMAPSMQQTRVSPSVYAAEPAYPVLAHSLLAKAESRITDTGDSANESVQTHDWNLKDDWDAGIRPNNSGIFQCGAVIGFSRLRSQSKDPDEYVGQIPRFLLTSHLLQSPPSSEPRAFIIFPSNFDALAPRILLNALQSASARQRVLSRTEALQYLDAVQLLPVQNFPNAAQAIAKVSESLQELQETRQNASAEPTQPVLLIAVGLDTLAEGVIRASNPVRGTVLLAATLRNLTRMSRAYSSWLSVLLVNTSGLGPAHFESHHPPDSNSTRNSGDQDARPTGDDGIHSIFQTPGSALLSTLLMKTLDQGIDTHILLSDVKAAQVAEVIKDRVGTGLGKWGIWSSKR